MCEFDNQLYLGYAYGFDLMTADHGLQIVDINHIEESN